MTFPRGGREEQTCCKSGGRRPLPEGVEEGKLRLRAQKLRSIKLNHPALRTKTSGTSASSQNGVQNVVYT